MILFWVFRYGFLFGILEVISYGKLKIISQSSSEGFLLKLQLHSEMKNHFIQFPLTIWTSLQAGGEGEGLIPQQPEVGVLIPEREAMPQAGLLPDTVY